MNGHEVMYVTRSVQTAAVDRKMSQFRPFHEFDWFGSGHSTHKTTEFELHSRAARMK